MDSILESVDLKPNLAYEVERKENIYVAGVNNAYFNPCRDVKGDLYLDRIDGKRTINLWNPKITNPFNKETREINNRVSEFYLRNLTLSCDSLDGLVNKINNKLFRDYKKRIDPADAEAFFSRIYEHYKQSADKVSEY